MKMVRPSFLEQFLTGQRSLLRQKVNAREDRELAAAFSAYCQEGKITPNYAEPTILATEFAEFLIHQIRVELKEIEELKRYQAEFNRRVHRASSRREEQEHILEFAALLGADGDQLRRDRRAFQRWFDTDTVVERCQRRIARREYRIADCLSRLGAMIVTALKADEDPKAQMKIWQRIRLERLVRKILVYLGDQRVRIAAFQCLSRTIAALPADLRGSTITDASLTFIYRSALAQGEHVWIQCEALSLLAVISPKELARALHRRLMTPEGKNDLFVRRRAVQLLGECLPSQPLLEVVIPYVLADPSDHVRQALAEAFATMIQTGSSNLQNKAWQWLSDLAGNDQTPQVRAACLLALIPLLDRNRWQTPIAELLWKRMEAEANSFVLRVALKVAAMSVAHLLLANREKPAHKLAEIVLPAVERLHAENDNLQVRRWAAMTQEQMAVNLDFRARRLKAQLEPLVQNLSPGKSRRISHAIFREHDRTTIGRVLAVLSQTNYELALAQGILGWRLYRGVQFRWRFWRIFHEMRRPSPDKRQGFKHTVGRAFKGSLRAPSAIMGELTQTKVPGEPLVIASEGDWRPFLPLPDEVLACLQHPLSNRPVEIFTSEGITSLTPPRSLLRRWWQAARLTLGFAGYAHLRNWRDNSGASPKAYARAVRKLGIDLQFKPHLRSSGSPAKNPAVERFFTWPLPLFDLNLQLKEYFFSAYENTLSDLALFALGLALVFLGTRLVMSRIAIANRRRIGLVIGGWGTRGKSGTERLKAAFFEALGHGQISKSTGCEAMFLYAFPFGKTREMFLFRPYDKATIWEQYDLLKLSTRMKTRVFLWECMALTPAYVRLLQHHWMRDDYATITNTYPDHEDIQGPAGINIPEVMTEFIPPRATLITSEEQMQPILATKADQIGTRLQSVGWLEAGLLTRDVLERFPYDEHPYNIALVCAMAKELGLDADYALKEMADRVIADIGVLKTFPKARVRDRWIQFINGMSANERFGTLSNWERMGLDRIPPHERPELFVSTVVNNRADRISRSQMFAKIVVADLSADRHFLIGSNLKGLMGYIHSAWEQYSLEITLWPTAEGKPADPLQLFHEAARRQRIPTRQSEVKARLAAMLKGLDMAFPEEKIDEYIQDPGKLKTDLESAHSEGTARETASHLARQIENLRAYERFAERINKSKDADQEALDQEFKNLVQEWFLEKIVIIEDFHATGDQVVDRILRETPPGLYNKVMGLQNIKGTGLDFVYRWQAWETCHHICQRLLEAEEGEFERTLGELSAFQEYGLLSESLVEETIEAVRKQAHAQTERHQAEIAMIRSRFEAAIHRIKSELHTQETESILSRIAAVIESFLDAGDAVRRRKTANRIYRDLANERISGERAAKELKALNRRQKGGWLYSRLQRWWPK